MPKVNDVLLNFKIGLAKGGHLSFSLVENRCIGQGVPEHI
jgi:hypothetical protein